MFSACQKVDEFSQPSIELKEKLADYKNSKNPKPIYEWVSTYHGEASGHQMMINFVNWGNQNVSDMNNLLSTWPNSNRKQVFYLLEWAATDSVTKIQFNVPQISQ